MALAFHHWSVLQFYIHLCLCWKVNSGGYHCLSLRMLFDGGSAKSLYIKEINICTQPWRFLQILKFLILFFKTFDVISERFLYLKIIIINLLVTYLNGLLSQVFYLTVFLTTLLSGEDRKCLCTLFLWNLHLVFANSIIWVEYILSF